MRCYARSSAFRSVNATAAASSPPTGRNEAAATREATASTHPTQTTPSQHQHAGHTNAREDHPRPHAPRAPDPNGAGGPAAARTGGHRAANWHCGRHHARKTRDRGTSDPVQWHRRPPRAFPSSYFLAPPPRRWRRSGSSNRLANSKSSRAAGRTRSHAQAWRGVQRRPQPRPTVARRGYDRSGPSRGSSPSSPSRPEPRRLSGHLRHTVPPGPPWRSAPIYQIHGSARGRGRITITAIRQRVVSPSDRGMGDTEPNQDQERDGNGTCRPLVMRQHICC